MTAHRTSGDLVVTWITGESDKIVSVRQKSRDMNCSRDSSSRCTDRWTDTRDGHTSNREWMLVIGMVVTVTGMVVMETGMAATEIEMAAIVTEMAAIVTERVVMETERVVMEIERVVTETEMGAMVTEKAATVMLGTLREWTLAAVGRWCPVIQQEMLMIVEVAQRQQPQTRSPSCRLQVPAELHQSAAETAKRPLEMP